MRFKSSVGESNSSNNANNSSSSDKGGKGSEKGKLRIPEWRTTFKGEKMTADGKNWVWCPHHKSEGLFDGLYMPEGHDHAKWKKEKEEKVKKLKERREKKKREKLSSTVPNLSNKLPLVDNLKSALATKLGVSDADAARLIEDAMPKE